MKTRIIAEAGVNHNGSLDMAMRLIDAAAEAGADVVKFQTFKAEQLVARSAPKADYQLKTTDSAESQFEMIKRLELDEAAHALLIAHCDRRGITFLSTPFDHASATLLTERFQLPCLKLPSGEITNAPLLLHVARGGRPLILSTGMSTLEEVEEALAVLAFGYLASPEAPSRAAFHAAYRSEEGQAALRQNVTLLHCTTEYPTPFEDVNLRAMRTLQEAFGLPIGLSDHTEGIAVPIAAVALGATVIEKHFTLDRTLPGPDHKASLEPAELGQMVRAIRQVEQAMGSAIKRPAPSEQRNRDVVRKSLVAALDLPPGTLLTEETLTVKRPGTGISPMSYWAYLGKAAGRSYRQDEPIDP